MIDLEAIEARIRDRKTYNFGLWNADKLAHEDAPAMLTELRHLRVVASGKQGAIVNSIIERTRHDATDDLLPGPSDAARGHLREWRECRNTPTDDEREIACSHPEASYSPEVFMAMQGLLNEAKGSPTHALRIAVSRQMSAGPSSAEQSAIIGAIDAIRNPFATSTREDELLVFEAAEKWAASAVREQGENRG